MGFNGGDIAEVPVTVHLPVSLQRFTGEQKSIELAGVEVIGALDQLTERFPRLREQIFSPNGSIRRFVNIFINDEDIRSLPGGNAAKLSAGDIIFILPAVAGG